MFANSSSKKRTLSIVNYHRFLLLPLIYIISKISQYLSSKEGGKKVLSFRNWVMYSLLGRWVVLLLLGQEVGSAFITGLVSGVFITRSVGGLGQWVVYLLLGQWVVYL